MSSIDVYKECAERVMKDATQLEMINPALFRLSHELYMTTLVIREHSRVISDVTAKLIAAHMTLARAFFTRLDLSMTPEV